MWQDSFDTLAHAAPPRRKDFPVNRRHFAISTTAALAALTLAACERKAPEAASLAAKPRLSAQEAYEQASRASGFTTGSMMAANTVYVFFDPTCPHCAELWASAKPLLAKLKIVWIPIGLLRGSSGPQGATILTAPDPVAAMEENEASVLDRKGGISVSPSLSDEAKARVEANTEVFRKTGEDSVPLIVFKNGQTGTFGMHAGAVATAELAAMAGV